MARVLARLGSPVKAYYLAGGATGLVLDHLLDTQRLDRCRMDIAGHTRISMAVFERETGREYRFVPEGPFISDEEWRGALDRMAHLDCDYLVASGSLPRGAPDDFYAQLRQMTADRGIRMVLDSSGPALRVGLAGGGLFLVKPSLGEFEQLLGRQFDDLAEVGDAARALVDAGQSSYVAVTMGHEGAVLAGPEGVMRLPAIPVEAKSAVGAGDSFVAATTFAFAHGWQARDAFRYGMAAGTAAVLTPGTDLCHKEDIDRLYSQLRGRN